jgi:putative inorganic carbon (HCO3(-)) transporter
VNQSIEYPLPVPAAQRWVRQVSTAAQSEGPKIGFALLLCFVVLLYSQITVVYKQLDVLRPVLVVAGAAIFMTIVEVAQSRRSYQFAWPQGILLVALVGVCFISSFDALWPKLGFNTTADFAKVVLIYVVIENTVTSESRLNKILLTMVFCSLMPALGVIYNYTHGVLVEGSRGAWKGLFGNPNEAAYGLVVLQPLALLLANRARWRLRLLLWGVIALDLLAILLTFSRGGLIGLFAVFGLAGWKQKSAAIRMIMIVGLFGAIVVAGLYWGRSKASFRNISEDTTYNQRITTIKAGIRMFEAHPLLGVGPGCSVVGYPIYVPPEDHCNCQLQLVVHNTFIQILSETGILGFAAFMLFLGRSLLDVWRLERSALSRHAAALNVALCGYIVCSLSGGFGFSWWPYLLIGLIVSARHIAESDPASRVAV